MRLLFVPKYHRISEILHQSIINNEYTEDNRLPTEKELCRGYNASRGTVRKALDIREQHGLIWREQG